MPKRRYGRRRPRSSEPMCEVKVEVRRSSKEKLDALAGDESLGWAFEKLVDREMMRRVKRMQKVNTPINGNDSALL